jgi:hypothetical protein
MKKSLRTLLFLLCLAALPSLSCSNSAFAASQYYLMWQMPASKISWPIYVYSKGVQVDYLYSQSQQAVISSYDPTATNGTYRLFYETNDSWYSCTVALLYGALDTTNTTCPGAVINKPVTTGNVYTLAMGATAWSASKAPPGGQPEKTNYGERKITFINNTDYDLIQIGEACTTSKNPNNPKCTNTENLFQIKKGESQEFLVDDAAEEGSNFPAGLTSVSFYLSAKQNAGGKLISTGGYGAGEIPYATKVELTSLPVTTSAGYPVPKGATNFDVSLVDGYNIGAIAYPASPTFCTYTVPPNGSNVLGAGTYGPPPRNSLASFPVQSSTSLPDLCSDSSQLPVPYTGKDTAWSLSLMDGNAFMGCRSPCSYAKANSEADENLFCCAGEYGGSPKACDQPKGDEGANTSTYVAELKTTSKNMYRYAYDDAVGDFACPAETNFVVVFQ